MTNKIANKTTIFIALLVITAVQIGLSYVPLGPGNLIAGLLLAAAEAILVGLYFMGLSNEQRLVRVTALFPVLLFIILNGAVILDVVIFRHW